MSSLPRSTLAPRLPSPAAVGKRRRGRAESAHTVTSSSCPSGRGPNTSSGAQHYLTDHTSQPRHLEPQSADHGTPILADVVLHHPAPRPRVTVTLDHRDITALLDTGATANFVREGICLAPIENAEVAQVLLAEGTTGAPILGKQRLHCLVGGVPTDVEAFVVANLREPVIFGCAFLDEQDAHLDMRRHCIHLGRGDRRTIHWVRERPTKQSTIDMAVVRNEFEKPADIDRLQQMLQRFHGVFSPDPTPTTTATMRHDIRLKDNTPVCVPPYRYSEEKRRVILSQVEEMLSTGVIEPSTSSYSSPIVVVNKKDGRPRFCVDFRRLNDRTEEEPSALPLIQQTVKDLGNAKIFTTLDLQSGYWQVPLTERSRPLTAFSTPTGAHYQFRVMPFGLRNAPATFQRLMAQEVLAGYLQEFALVYLDDIIVYSATVEEHFHHLHLIFERLQLHRLRCGLAKCVFGSNRLEYLGYLITSEGNLPKTEHLQSIVDAVAPRNRKDLRQFLGACNWVREFGPRFAEVAAPLTDLLRKSVKFRWGEEEARAFEDLKRVLSNPPPLSRPDPRKRLILQTDASQRGMAAVLYQESDTEGEKQVISYASARFNQAEKRYHANEQECLAVVWAVKKYRPYLEDRRFLVRTDSRALTWLHSAKDQKAKLTRWSILLQGFAFDIEHVPGRANQLPDFLSRAPAPLRKDEDLGDDEDLVPPEAAVLEFHTLADEVRAGQANDRAVEGFRRRLRGPDGLSLKQTYDDVEGILHYLPGEHPTIYVVDRLRERVLYEHHDSSIAGHPGAEETLRAIGTTYHWPTMKRDVEHYVQQCVICARYKRRPQHPRASLRPRQPATPFETVACDFMGPYPRTPDGNTYIFVVTDLFSRWVEAFALPDSTLARTITKLEEVFGRFGYPRQIITDNGPQFEARAWANKCREWKTLHWTTADYHPQANPTERRNQELKKGLRIRLDGEAPDHWDQRLTETLASLRRRCNAATGKTPSQILLGRTTRAPGEWDVREEGERNHEQQHQEAREEQERYHARRYPVHQRNPEPFAAGQLVLVKNFAPDGPFAERWKGPHKVIASAGQNHYFVRIRRRDRKIHIDNMRPAPPRRRPPGAVQETPGD